MYRSKKIKSFNLVNLASRIIIRAIGILDKIKNTMPLKIHRPGTLAFATIFLRPLRSTHRRSATNAHRQSYALPTRHPRRTTHTAHIAANATNAANAANSAKVANAMAAAPNTLYVVATPIGNVRDLTERARHVLLTATMVAAEDTRVTATLLRAADIPRPRTGEFELLSCHAHNVGARIPRVLATLAGGGSVALVTDAGTPCISDPGASVVSAATHAGARVVALPGACAAVVALAGSGLPPMPFSFLGFLPRSAQARRDAVAALADLQATAVFYEAPHRLVAVLDELAANPAVAARRITLARELTKKYEQYLRFADVAQARLHFQTVEPRGEFTIVLAPALPLPPQQSLTDYSSAKVNIPNLVQALIRHGVPVSTVAKIVASSSDVPKKLVYSYAMQFKDSLEDSNSSLPENNEPSNSISEK